MAENIVNEVYEEITYRGLKFKVRTAHGTDKRLVRGVLLQKDYSLEGIELKTIHTVIDIGAHVGSFSMITSKYVKQVIAFEPDPEGYRLCLENVATNNRNNITVVNKAIGETTQKLKFYLGLTSGRNTLCNTEFTKTQKIIDVDCIGINDLFTQYKIIQPILLKMDIEGAEYTILNKISDENLKKIKILVLEAHQYADKTWSYFTIIKLLEDKGFKLSKIYPAIVTKNILGVTIKAVRDDK